MANKLYVARETAITFSDTGSPVITLNNLAAGAARVSARKDMGAGSQAEWYQWRATFQAETAPVVGEAVHLYVAESDGTDEDGDIGTADAALTTVNTLPNLHYIGSVIVENTSADDDFRASGVFRMTSRYFSIVVYNATADNLQAANDINKVVVTPIPAEIQ